MDDKEIGFVVSKYRKGAFNAEQAWRKLGIRKPFHWRRFNIAASVAIAIVLTASAAIYTRLAYTDSAESPARQTEVPAAQPLAAVVSIDFEDAPLSEVAAKIESTYGVKVSGLNEENGSLHLSLHYEGTATDLVNTINEILGTDLTVREK